LDHRATSAATGELLGWTPSGPTLLEDLAAGAYPAAAGPASGEGQESTTTTS
jgi:hypothetical protein